MSVVDVHVCVAIGRVQLRFSAGSAQQGKEFIVITPRNSICVFVAALAVVACDVPTDRVGKDVDKAAKKIGNQVDKAADKTKESISYSRK